MHRGRGVDCPKETSLRVYRLCRNVWDGNAKKREKNVVLLLTHLYPVPLAHSVYHFIVIIRGFVSVSLDISIRPIRTSCIPSAQLFPAFP